MLLPWGQQALLCRNYSLNYGEPSMDKKTIIIFFLVGIAVIFLFMVLGSFREVNTLRKERVNIIEENSGLKVKAEVALQASRHLEEKIASLNKDLESVNAERNDLSQRFEALLQDKGRLTGEIDKLKTQFDKRESS